MKNEKELFPKHPDDLAVMVIFGEYRDGTAAFRCFHIAEVCEGKREKAWDICPALSEGDDTVRFSVDREGNIMAEAFLSAPCSEGELLETTCLLASAVDESLPVFGKTVQKRKNLFWHRETARCA